MKWRSAVAAVLLVLLALEVLPFTIQEAPPAACGISGGLGCRIEPLQVCDDGDHFLGGVADFLVLVPGALVLVVSPEVLRLAPGCAHCASEGFSPAIDHPPQLSA